MGEKCESCIWFLVKAVQESAETYKDAIRREASGIPFLDDLKTGLKIIKKDVKILEKNGCIDPVDAAMIKEEINKAVKSNNPKEIEDAAYFIREKLMWDVSKTTADACQRK